MFINFRKRGQSTLEYAVVIAVVVGALIASQTYFKRGVQGKFKQASDDIGEQFSPGASTYDYTTTSSTTSTDTVAPVTATAAAGGTTTPDTTDALSKNTTTVSQTQERYGTEYISPYDDTNENWGNKSPGTTGTGTDTGTTDSGI